MPQLDIVTFFNQISWLTIAFLALLPLFHLLVLRAHSQITALRNSVFIALKSIELPSSIDTLLVHYKEAASVEVPSLSMVVPQALHSFKAREYAKIWK